MLEQSCWIRCVPQSPLATGPGSLTSMGGCVAIRHSGHMIVLLPPRPEETASPQHHASEHEIDGELFLVRPLLDRHQPPPQVPQPADSTGPIPDATTGRPTPEQASPATIRKAPAYVVDTGHSRKATRMLISSTKSAKPGSPSAWLAFPPLSHVLLENLLHRLPEQIAPCERDAFPKTVTVDRIR